jgi:hypothetical protein
MMGQKVEWMGMGGLSGSGGEELQHPRFGPLDPGINHAGGAAGGPLPHTFLNEFRTVEGEQGRAWRMEPVSVEWLVRRLTRCAKFMR